MGAETGRSIAFSVKNLAVVPLPGNLGGLSAGVPIAIDTPMSAEIKIDLTLEEIRGGAYLFPLAADIKEMKAELSAKLTDTPPALVSLLTGGSYTKVVATGPALTSDGVQNIQGTTVGARCVVTTPGTPVNGDYAIVATAAQSYTVYDLSTGKPATAVTTSSTVATVDTTSVAGVTITTGFAPTAFVANDAGTFSVVNIGSGQSGVSINETVIGPIAYPVVPPQARLYGIATRRASVFKFILYYTELEGLAYPMKQGGYVESDFKARVLTPPYNAATLQPWRFDLVA